MLVEINGNRLNVEIMGADDAPLLIAHHGAPGLGSLAEPRASFGQLSDTYRVLVFDARGSGQSEGNGPFTHEQWAADVEGLRQWAGAERFVMAGGAFEHATGSAVRAIVGEEAANAGLQLFLLAGKVELHWLVAPCGKSAALMG